MVYKRALDGHKTIKIKRNELFHEQTSTFIQEVLEIEGKSLKMPQIY